MTIKKSMYKTGRGSTYRMYIIRLEYNTGVWARSSLLVIYWATFILNIISASQDNPSYLRGVPSFPFKRNMSIICIFQDWNRTVKQSSTDQRNKSAKTTFRGGEMNTAGISKSLKILFTNILPFVKGRLAAKCNKFSYCR